MAALGILQSIADLRSVWRQEDNFTSWLAENIELLGKAIGVRIGVIERESPVGIFRADLLAEDLDNNSSIIIENQLTETDHDHLGKLITYASGKDAAIIIWIAKKAKDEHRKAIEWLNSHSADGLGFFLIEIELWRIDGSKIAPKFNIVERPNAWAVAIRQPTDLRKTQLKFWTEFREYASQNLCSAISLSRMPKPKSDYKCNVEFGHCGIHFNLDSYKNIGAVGVYVSNDPRLIKLFENKKREIEDRFFSSGEKLETSLGEKDARFFVAMEMNIQQVDAWPDYFGWFCDKASILYNVLQWLTQLPDAPL